MEQVAEDVKLVTHIKDVFLSLQDSSVGHVTDLLQYSMKSSLYMVNISGSPNFFVQVHMSVPQILLVFCFHNET